jgi:predicted MFS family arabinose efflux permease
MHPFTASQPRLSERSLILLLAAVHFVNVLDFMMVMPLGPDLARALDMPAARLGVVGGSYTAAAALGGLLGMFFLDRFDRRRALAVAMTGLVLATAAGALAQGTLSLVAARMLAGLFGGPATALALAIVADVVPLARRGKAIAALLGGSAAASVLGVPAGLELARIGGWRAPFLAVAGIGGLVVACAVALMPPLLSHLAREPRQAAQRPLLRFLSDGRVLLALVATGAASTGIFSIVPHLSGFLQHNLGFPRERIGLLFLAGGLVAFVAARLAGVIVDRSGPFIVAAFGTVLLALDLTLGIVLVPARLPALAIFVGLMVSNSVRLVSLNALASRIPPPQERARFMSLLSVVQHMSAATGALLSSVLVNELPDGRLTGMPAVAALAMTAAAVVPVAVSRALSAERELDRRATLPGAPLRLTPPTPVAQLGR